MFDCLLLIWLKFAPVRKRLIIVARILLMCVFLCLQSAGFTPVTLPVCKLRYAE